MNKARMLGNLRDQGCGFGKHCTCNNYYRTPAVTRATKRRERQTWKREVQSHA